MIDARAQAKVEAYIKIGKQEGRIVALRDTVGPGYFIGPVVVADVLPEHRLAQEEIFGPVLAVMRANDCADALRIANHSSYALTGGIYSRSPKNIGLARTTFDVGNTIHQSAHYGGPCEPATVWRAPTLRRRRESGEKTISISL